jgi:hypothetical protein
MYADRLSLAPTQAGEPAFSGGIEFLAGQIDTLTESLAHELPSGFVERVRYLASDLTPFPGRFSFERFPCFRKTAGCFSPLDPAQEVVLMKGNQTGATTATLETVLLCSIMSDPKAQMYVTADAGLMRTSVQVRVEKMIDNAGARDLIFIQPRKKKGSRNTGDTAIAKADRQNRKTLPCRNPREVFRAVQALRNHAGARWHGKDGYEYGIVWENDAKHNPIRETVSYRCRNKECGGLMKNFGKAVIIPKGEWWQACLSR